MESIAGGSNPPLVEGEIDFVGERGPVVHRHGGTLGNILPQRRSIYAVTCRGRTARGRWRVEAWEYALAVGSPLPLWLTEGHGVPLELEATYEDTAAGCGSRGGQAAGSRTRRQRRGCTSKAVRYVSSSGIITHPFCTTNSGMSGSRSPTATGSTYARVGVSLS